jgi:hypothetical protein
MSEDMSAEAARVFVCMWCMHLRYAVVMVDARVVTLRTANSRARTISESSCGSALSRLALVSAEPHTSSAVRAPLTRLKAPSAAPLCPAPPLALRRAEPARAAARIWADTLSDAAAGSAGGAAAAAFCSPSLAVEAEAELCAFTTRLREAEVAASLGVGFDFAFAAADLGFGLALGLAEAEAEAAPRVGVA